MDALLEPLSAGGIVHSAFYQFIDLPDPPAVAQVVRALAACLTGSVVVAGEGINGAVAGSYGPSAPRHFLAGPAGSVFLLHPLAAHGVVAPAAGVRLRRALLRLYPADLSLRDATACEAEARAVEQPFGRWRQALARLRDLCAVA